MLLIISILWLVAVPFKFLKESQELFNGDNPTFAELLKFVIAVFGMVLGHAFGIVWFGDYLYGIHVVIWAVAAGFVPYLFAFNSKSKRESDPVDVVFNLLFRFFTYILFAFSWTQLLS